MFCNFSVFYQFPARNNGNECMAVTLLPALHCDCKHKAKEGNTGHPGPCTKLNVEYQMPQIIPGAPIMHIPHIFACHRSVN